MKKQYVTMKLKIVQYNTADVVTLSTGSERKGDDYFTDIYEDFE